MEKREQSTLPLRATKKTAKRKLSLTELTVEFKEKDGMTTRAARRNKLRDLSSPVVRVQEHSENETGEVSSSVCMPPSKPFDYDAAVLYLSEKDPKLGEIIKKSKKRCDPILQAHSRTKLAGSFMALSRAIIYQQLHGKAANTILKRFITHYFPEYNGDKAVFPTPFQVKETPVTLLRSLGLSQRKAEYILSLSTAYVDNLISDEILQNSTDIEIRKLLTSIRGIGDWTVDMFMMFEMGKVDILPVGDLAIRKGLAMHFGSANKGKRGLPGSTQMEQWTSVWAPYRSIGCYFMWHLLEIDTPADKNNQ